MTLTGMYACMYVRTYSLTHRSYLEDLEQGVFIQQTLDGVLKDMDGKQLLVRYCMVWYCHIQPLTLLITHQCTRRRVNH